MRKRIVIGLLAVVVIGVVAFFVSQAKKGSVEWHKREYLEAVDRLTRNSRSIGLKNLLTDITGLPLAPSNAELERRMILHRDELVARGFLAKHDFVISNKARGPVSQAIFSELYKMIPPDRQAFVSFDDRDTNVVYVVAFQQDIALVQELIRKTDVPENTK